jgi:hypothetical protein
MERDQGSDYRYDPRCGDAAPAAWPAAAAFSELEDDREPWRGMCPPKEVLLLVTREMIA